MCMYMNVYILYIKHKPHECKMIFLDTVIIDVCVYKCIHITYWCRYGMYICICIYDVYMHYGWVKTHAPHKHRMLSMNTDNIYVFV